MYYKISNKLDIELLREMETLLSESYSVYKTVMERTPKSSYLIMVLLERFLNIWYI